MTKKNGEARPLEEIEQLLPFAHAGRLLPTEKRLLDAAIAERPEFARQLATIAEEAEATIAVNEAIAGPSIEARETLFARIDAELEPPKSSAAARLRRWLTRQIEALSPQALAWTTAALLLVVVAETGAITSLLIGPKGDTVFETASHEAAPGEKFLIAFAPEASIADVEQFLQTHAASIVDGPHSGGIFSVRFGEKTLSDGERARMLAELRANAKLLRFVAPSR